MRFAYLLQEKNMLALNNETKPNYMLYTGAIK